MKRVAYLVLCHTDPPQLKRLTNALDHRADFFIHVDLKSDISAFMALSLPNTARFIEERERVSWGGFSLLDYFSRRAFARRRPALVESAEVRARINSNVDGRR